MELTILLLLEKQILKKDCKNTQNLGHVMRSTFSNMLLRKYNVKNVRKHAKSQKYLPKKNRRSMTFEANKKILF